jgi:predicted protein tyrosine phosphatase
LTLSKVTERLYIGDWQEARDAVAPNLVKVTVAKDSPYVGDYYFPLIDANDPNNMRVLNDAIRTVHVLMKQNRTVLVHCVSGISRSCVVIMGYLNLIGIPLEESLMMVKKARPVVSPEPDLIELLPAVLAELKIDGEDVC